MHIKATDNRGKMSQPAGMIVSPVWPQRQSGQSGSTQANRSLPLLGVLLAFIMLSQFPGNHRSATEARSGLILAYPKFSRLLYLGWTVDTGESRG
jgi:hypothetical protein